MLVKNIALSHSMSTSLTAHHIHCTGVAGCYTVYYTKIYVRTQVACVEVHL